MRGIEATAWVVLGLVLGITLATAIHATTPAAAAGGNPQGHRAGGRFDYVQYDDAMEVLTDNETGWEYLVWYYRDEVEVVPLGAATGASE